ncbi:MAG: sulfotransferase [Xanthomonadales bacterium]|jgi:tetratricopeptide (TPR) repeat protein|nr:sulfotransferase [Xanthomonadales bacterium]
MARNPNSRPTPRPGRSPTRQEDPAPESELALIRAQLAGGRIAEARREAESLGERHPDSPAVLRLRGQAAEAVGDWRAALAIARRATELRPRNIRARLHLVRALWQTGQVARALEMLDGVSRTAAHRPGAMARVGACYAGLGLHEPAYRCFLRALEHRPEDPVLLASVADSAAALGKVAVARSHADRALFIDPEQLPLLERRTRWSREASVLRNSPKDDADELTRERVNQLGFQLDRLPPDDPRRAPVCYALASELDALGHLEPAFGIWCEGARCQLLAERHDGSTDRAHLLRATEAFDAAWFDAQPAALAGVDGGADRVFLTGLPAAGLGWLADRLRAVPGVEVQCDTGFVAQALALASPGRGAGSAGFDSAGDASATGGWARHAGLQPGDWRGGYLESSRALARWREGIESPAVTVDVASSHLGALGLIRAAFPDAAIIHLRRDPLDHCFALFTTRYPRGRAWSYDLRTLARHYAAYHHLMGHWRRRLPGGFVDLDVEALILDPHRIADCVVAHPGSDAPRSAGHAEPAASPTEALRIGRASAYQQHLSALAERLRADGVPVR